MGWVSILGIKFSIKSQFKARRNTEIIGLELVERQKRPGFNRQPMVNYLI